MNKKIKDQIKWLVLEAETPGYRPAARRQMFSDIAKSLQQLSKENKKLKNEAEAKDKRIAALEGDRNNLLIALQQIYEGDYEIGEHIELACRALDCS